MYGFVFEAIKSGCFNEFNKKMWQDISRNTGLPEEVDFSMDYEDKIFYKLVEGSISKMKFTRSATFQQFGRWFIRFVWGQWNMGVMGRTPVDFFRNWNDFLEYKSQEYPLYVHNTFTVKEEDSESMILEYATTYEEMTCFCLGMIEYVLIEKYDVAKQNLQILAELETAEEWKEEKNMGKYFKTLFRVKFDNKWFKNSSNKQNLTLTTNMAHSSTLKTSQILKLFPFFIHFDRNLDILHAGIVLRRALPNIVGSSMDSLFSLKQPSNGSLTYAYIIGNLHMTYLIRLKSNSSVGSGNESDAMLIFQGQMVEAVQGNSILFLGNPTAGCFLGTSNTFFIGDLAPGYYKQTVISLVCLKNSLIEHSLDLEKENEKYRRNCAESLFKTVEMSNTLLNQLMPPHIHKAVRVGRPYGDTCEIHSEVTVLLSDMVGFTKICSQISPMEVARMLNAMYMVFDNLLSAKNSLYKAETIGDGYMVVVGIPDKQEKHAEFAADLAIDMLKGLKNIELPFLENNNFSVKIGMHSGPIVAGVIGWKVPRYSVFGDTVNVVNALESTSKPHRIHISDSTYKLLSASGGYIMRTRRRSSVISSKISRKLREVITQTYWLCGKGSEYVSTLDPEDPEPGAGEEASKEVVNELAIMKEKDEEAALSTMSGDMSLLRTGPVAAFKAQVLQSANKNCKVQ